MAITVKLYDCNICSATMLVEIFADEQTALEIMKQNPSCSDCEQNEQNKREQNEQNKRWTDSLLDAF
jgi:hypothetical protein